MIEKDFPGTLEILVKHLLCPRFLDEDFPDGERERRFDFENFDEDYEYFVSLIVNTYGKDANEILAATAERCYYANYHVLDALVRINGPEIIDDLLNQSTSPFYCRSLFFIKALLSEDLDKLLDFFTSKDYSSLDHAFFVRSREDLEGIISRKRPDIPRLVKILVNTGTPGPINQIVASILQKVGWRPESLAEKLNFHMHHGYLTLKLFTAAEKKELTPLLVEYLLNGRHEEVGLCLEDLGWEPSTPEEWVAFCLWWGHWELNPDELDKKQLVKALKAYSPMFSNHSPHVLHIRRIRWDLQSLEDKVIYYLFQRNWFQLVSLGEEGKAVLREIPAKNGPYRKFIAVMSDEADFSTLHEILDSVYTRDAMSSSVFHPVLANKIIWDKMIEVIHDTGTGGIIIEALLDTVFLDYKNLNLTETYGEYFPGDIVERHDIVRETAASFLKRIADPLLLSYLLVDYLKNRLRRLDLDYIDINPEDGLLSLLNNGVIPLTRKQDDKDGIIKELHGQVAFYLGPAKINEIRLEKALAGKTGAERIEILATHVTSGNDGISGPCCKELVSMKSPLALKIFNEAYFQHDYDPSTDAHDNCRREIMDSLDETAVDQLKLYLADSEVDDFTRGDAAFLLGKLGDESTVDVLLEHVNPRENMRQKAIEGLGELSKRLEPRHLVRIVDPLIELHKVEWSSSVFSAVNETLGYLSSAGVPVSKKVVALLEQGGKDLWEKPDRIKLKKLYERLIALGEVSPTASDLEPIEQLLRDITSSDRPDNQSWAIKRKVEELLDKLTGVQ